MLYNIIYRLSQKRNLTYSFTSITNRFYLQLKPGGLIRVHTSALQPTSQYKSLVISEETTSDELLSLLLSSYNSNEPVEQFSLYEVSECMQVANFMLFEFMQVSVEDRRT